MKEILFRISRPYKVFNTKKVAALQLPAVDGDITILPDRAPTLLLLRNGIVRILDNQLKVIESYFVKGGIADIARNRCAVSSEKVFCVDGITLERAKEKMDSALHDEDKNFYQYVISVLDKKS